MVSDRTNRAMSVTRGAFGVAPALWMTSLSLIGKQTSGRIGVRSWEVFIDGIDGFGRRLAMLCCRNMELFGGEDTPYIRIYSIEIQESLTCIMSHGPWSWSKALLSKQVDNCRNGGINPDSIPCHGTMPTLSFPPTIPHPHSGSLASIHPYKRRAT